MTIPGIGASTPHEDLYLRLELTSLPPDTPARRVLPVPKDVVVASHTRTFGVALDRSATVQLVQRQAQLSRIIVDFRGRILSGARDRLSDNRARLDAAETRVNKYGDPQWADLRFEAVVQRDLAKQEQYLVGQIAVLWAGAVTLDSNRVAGSGWPSPASQSLHAQVSSLTSFLSEVRAQRLGLQQAHPAAAVLAESDLSLAASPKQMQDTIRRGFGAVRSAIARADVELQSGEMNPMDLSMYVAEQVTQAGLVVKAGAGDEGAQAIINSIAGHRTMALGLQVGRSAAVVGLSVAALFLGGGVAIAGGLAGAGDAALNIQTAAQLGRFVDAASVGGVELVDAEAAQEAQMLAWVDLAFGVLDVVQVGSMVRGLAQGRQLQRLFATQDVLTSLSAGQQHRVHVWVRQQATGQTAAAAKSRRGLESELGLERFSKVDQAFGRMLEGVGSSRVEVLRSSLGEAIFTKLSARFGAKDVAKWTNKHGAKSVRRLAESLNAETAGALLKGLDPQSLARLDGLDPKTLVDFGGQLGLSRLNEVSRHLTGEQLLHLHDKVGPDFERLLRGPDFREFADPDVVQALADAPRQVVHRMLGNALSPRLIAGLIRETGKLPEVVRVPLLKYLAKSPLTEATAALKVLQAEARDGAHAVARHGPHITEAQLRKRIATGVAPDGSQGNGHWAATRFRSFRVMWRSRQAAFQGLKAKGIDVRFGPGQHGNPTDSPVLITIEHGRDVSRGVFSAAPHVQIPKPGVLGGTVKSFGDAVDSAGYITRTQAKISWEEGRWQVKQHFPGVHEFDRYQRMYTQPASVYVQGCNENL